MITMQDLDEAIAECRGQPNPNASTCIKLAAYLTIKNSMLEQDRDDIKLPDRSFSAPDQTVVNLDSDSEFAEHINGMSVESVIDLFDKVMETLQVVNPRLYAAIMRKL